MPRIFKLQQVTFLGSEQTLNNSNCRIEFNNDENAGNLDIAVYVLTSTFFSDPNNGITLMLNDSGTDQPLTGIIANSKDTAIYQVSIPLDDFKLKDNIINFRTTHQQTDTSNNKVITVSSSAFATATGFVDEAAPVEIRLQRTSFEQTSDIVFWNAILKTNVKFSDYRKFIDTVLCVTVPNSDASKQFNRHLAKNRSPFVQTEEYSLIKFATEYFMLLNLGVPKDQLSGYLVNGKLPYFDLVSQALDDDNFNTTLSNAAMNDCIDRNNQRASSPFMIELIWSYWMEQGMLVQTMNAISLRFQNLYNLPYIKPLERFDVDPLRPLSHILWGYIQDEQHRLSLKRRVYEYDHEYGLNLIGRAIPNFNPVDSRVKFLEVFHDLLTSCTVFFREADDTTRIPDAFPVLNNLRETHLLLASGNHNAYGDLTWTARHEMMVQQYILARKEMREFLGGKPMVAYNEEWMDRVETMRSLQGWGATSIINYYELAVTGEQILISIRYGNWNDVNLTSDNAGNWARAFRDRIQRYIHAYRVVTGVDISEEAIDSKAKAQRYIQPSLLIQQRLLQAAPANRRA